MRENNKWLMVSVALVAAVSLGAYVFRFWGLGVSNNPKHWADFAVYISGTVGVAAVVATLVAFVKTLGQQQELIDSQEQMLEEQKRQIDLAEAQRDELKRNHEVDVAYSSTTALFSDFCSNFERSLEKGVPVYASQRELKAAFEKLEYSTAFLRSALLQNPNKILSAIHMAKIDEWEAYVERVFESISRLYQFMVRQVEAAPELKFYFENYLYAGDYRHNIMYFHLYQAYLIGKENNELIEKGVRYLNLQRAYPESTGISFLWYEVGRKIKEIKAAEV